MDGVDLPTILQELKTKGLLYDLDLSLLILNNTWSTEKMCLCLLATSISFAVANIVPVPCQGNVCPWSKLWEAHASSETTAMYILDTVLEEFTELGYENRSLLEGTLLIAIGEAKNGTLNGSLGNLLLRSLMIQLEQH